MAQFASLTLAHPENAHLGGRASVLVADVTLCREGAREAAGLADRSFDFVDHEPAIQRRAATARRRTR